MADGGVRDIVHGRKQPDYTASGVLVVFDISFVDGIMLCLFSVSSYEMFLLCVFHVFFADVFRVSHLWEYIDMR